MIQGIPAGCTHVTVNPRRSEVPPEPCHRPAIWRIADTGEELCGRHRYDAPTGAIKVPIDAPGRLPKRIVVAGHALVAAGRPHNRDGVLLPKGTRNGYAICACRARSLWLTSRVSRRDWHNDHKLAALARLAREDADR